MKPVSSEPAADGRVERGTADGTAVGYRLLPHVRFERNDTGGVVFCEETGALYTVNATGARVLESLARGDGPDAAADALAAGTGVSPPDVRLDVSRFLAALIDQGLAERA